MRAQCEIQVSGEDFSRKGVIMQIFTHQYTCPASGLAFMPNPERYLLLDIETTGIMSSRSKIYLLGLGEMQSFADNELHITFTQYFSENFSDELKMLQFLQEKISKTKGFITYNGNQFDLRFIQDCADAYHMDLSLKRSENIDFLHMAKKYRNLLGFKSVKQREVESVLGFSRKGRYEKPELIEWYHRYLQKKDEQILHILLSHQQDDLHGLVHLFRLLSLEQLLSGEWRYDGSENADSFVSDRNRLPDNRSYIDLRYISVNHTRQKHDESDFALKARMNLSEYFSFSKTGTSTAFSSAGEADAESSSAPRECNPKAAFDYALQIDRQTLTLRLPLLHASLKYFLPNYKDYDYLISENHIMHKSLTAYVLGSNKRRARKEEAFLIKHSAFIPMFELGDLKPYKAEYGDKVTYLEAGELLHRPEILPQLLHRLLTLLKLLP